MQGAPASQQPMQTQMQYQQPMFAPQAFPYSCEVIWISSEKEAEDYIVAKNSAVALWDRKNSVLYLKETDASGQPHMDAYDLSKRGEEKAAAAPVPQIDLSRYVTLEQMEDILTERLKRPARAEGATSPRPCSSISRASRATPWSSCKASSTAGR